MLCVLSNTGGTHVSLGLGHTAGAEILQGDVWVATGEPADVATGEPADVAPGEPADVATGEPADVAR